MPSYTEPAGPQTAPSAERARGSLREGIDRLERTLGDVGQRIELAEQIRRNPLPAVGIALALGMLAGGARRRAPAAPSERSLGATALATLGALSLRVVRELAVSQLSDRARRWWADRHAAWGEPGDEIDPIPGADPFYGP